MKLIIETIFTVSLCFIATQSCISKAFATIKPKQWAAYTVDAEIKRLDLKVTAINIVQVCEPERVGDDDELMRACDIVLDRTS